MATQSLTVTFTDAELDWHRSKALSDAAAIAYRGEVARLAKFCASLGIAEISGITPEHWTAYVSCLSKDRSTISSQWKPLKPSSALQALRITRAFLLHCAKMQWINWDPREVAMSMPAQRGSSRTQSAEIPLPESLRQVLVGEPQATDERQARRHFALGLGFWGALSPRELTLLKVRNIRISPSTGIGELTCEHRPHSVILPAELGRLWLRYRDCRQDAMSRKVEPTSALIASLRGGEPLCAWSVWALMQADGVNGDGLGEAINPRLLRQAYVERAARNAARDIGMIRSQVGKATNASGDQSLRLRRRALDSLHEATLANLRKAL